MLSYNDVIYVRQLAQDRKAWKDLTDKITKVVYAKYMILY